METSATEIVDDLVLDSRIKNGRYPSELKLPRMLFESYRLERTAFQVTVGASLPSFMPSETDLLNLKIAQAFEGPHGVRLVPDDQNEVSTPNVGPST